MFKLRRNLEDTVLYSEDIATDVVTHIGCFERETALNASADTLWPLISDALSSSEILLCETQRRRLCIAYNRVASDDPGGISTYCLMLVYGIVQTSYEDICKRHPHFDAYSSAQQSWWLRRYSKS